MSVDQKIIIEQIDSILNQSFKFIKRADYSDLSDLHYNKTVEYITLLSATIERFAPPGSRYLGNMYALFENYGEDRPLNLSALFGILKALRNDYENGYLQRIHELIHADIFSDFLEMADYLIKEGYKDPAAVIAGGVIEEHLRKLCQKNNIEIIKDDSRYKTADSLNSELAKANVYKKLDQKSITAWLDLRNKAAHGKYDDYTINQVELMLQGIRDFISRCAA
ncbi:MAG: DUF4145 domain-containing protein [Candidatus Lokiarchaeota archaeon]|nr:DUF4145 domain-containing protein [Candidatus Lokiarchaeota archaeon]